jgi:hypothetical protein
MVLVALDTDRIKSYVFATSKLREIRGASALLDELNLNRVRQMVGEDRVVYAGGGAALVEVARPEEAESLIREVEKEYRRRTASAELTGAWIEMDDPTVSFGEYSRRLSWILKERKNSKAGTLSLATSPLIKVCRSCGYYAASHRDAVDDALLCRSCKLKREVSDGVRHVEAGSLLGDLISYAHAKGKWQGVTFENNAPRDFNDVGDASSPGGYVGFIYCDGNRMGELLQKLPTREAFSQFSEGVRDTLRRVAFDSLLKCFPNRAYRRLPFEIIFIGGDDLVMVVQADKAIDLVIEMCREFERRTGPILAKVGLGAARPHLSLSAAVVLAHSSLPIYHLQSIADDLLKLAKRRSLEILEKGNGEVGSIDFHVVTASASESPSYSRKADWTRTDSGQVVSITERPYTPQELDVLVRRIRELKAVRFPSNKIQMLYEAIMDDSKTQAMFTWALIAGRSKKAHLPKLVSFFQEADGPFLWPWRERGGTLSTPMVDVAELLDFIN